MNANEGLEGCDNKCDKEVMYQNDNRRYEQCLIKILRRMKKT